MILSRDLKGVEAVYRDSGFDASEDYWFSYRNKQGGLVHAFKDRLVLLLGTDHEFAFSDIDEASLHVPNVRSASTCAINLRGRFGEIALPVDTVSKEQFLDVFPLQKALARHILMMKREKTADDVAR